MGAPRDGPTSPMLRSSSTIVTAAFCAKERVSTNKALTRSIAKSTTVTHVYSGDWGPQEVAGALRVRGTDGPTSPMLRSSSTIVTAAFCAKERVSTNKALTRSIAKSATVTHIKSEAQMDAHHQCCAPT